MIGAGVGGLTAAALLLREGYAVTVLEAHVYPGGSAGTFFHKGYRFDAGATLAGGFGPDGPHRRIGQWLGLEWPVQAIDPAWVVRVGDEEITQWADAERWQEERKQKLAGSEPFWRRQEQLADISWRISSQNFPWPPANFKNILDLSQAMRPWLAPAVPYLLSPMASLFPRNASRLLRTFVDAQLLISAQTTSQHASALYGSAALDLPRRGVNQVKGGMGGIARTLAEWITANGGQIHYRQAVNKVEVREGKAVGVTTEKGLAVGFDGLIANLTPWGLHKILGEASPKRLKWEVENRAHGWGAFMLYLGVKEDILGEFPGHMQMVVDPSRPLGEGNSVFISASGPNDTSRAPTGMRAVTVSSHTRVDEWWRLYQQDPDGYASKKADYTEKIMAAMERVIPEIRQGAQLVLPGTPVTFERFTRRPLGMAGGFPQTSILRARGPRTGLQNAWLVGDSVFPGQSTAGVSLGAIRVAREMMQQDS